jgi:glycosyltransferase involved in cell wall biosynthesis
MRRLLVVLDSLSLPSSYASALQYREPLIEAGYDVRFIVRDQPEGFEQRDRAANWAWRLRMPRRSHRMKSDIRRRWDDRIVELAREYDVVYAVKIPSLELHERILAAGPRLLVLFTDALWLPWARERGWDDWERILSIAHGVLTVNEFTAARARQYNPRVFIMHDSPQVEDFGTPVKDPNLITLGWIGSAATATSLFRIWEPLETLFGRYANLHLRLVGTGAPSLLNLPRFENVRWSARESYDHDSMIEEVLRMDIGLFPLFRGDDALARGALKAAIYMSGEAAVVAQRYGEAPELIEDGVNGMLADSDREWIEKIAYLIDHPAERRAIAARGLATARERFSRARTFEQLRHAIDSV